MKGDDEHRAAELAREGEYWTVVFTGRELRVRDSKGVGYLAQLLASPDREISVMALVGGSVAEPGSVPDAVDAGLASVRDSDAGALLDAEARRAYRDRLLELRAEIDEAERFHDPERAAHARIEFDAIAGELSAATGLGGRDRRSGSVVERARLNVSRSIGRAIERIAEHDRELGEHLSVCVQTGRVCVYRPDRGEPVRWLVSTRGRSVPPPPASVGPLRADAATGMPQTRYARSGDGTHIAYQVVGDGAVDLVFVPGWVSHLELDWEIGGLERFINRLAAFARVIRFDKRGTGLSDRLAGDAVPTLEQRMDDLRAVLDAVGSDRSALFGVSEAGPMCVLFAATYPQRTASLILYGSHATAKLDGDRGFRALIADKPDELIREAEAGWGEGFGFEYFAPSLALIPEAKQAWARYQRSAASPAAASAIIRMSLHSDVVDLLGSVHVPTLVLHRKGDRAVGVVHGRYMAECIPGARYTELIGEDHFWHLGDAESILAAIEEFLTGTEPIPADAHRVLATVLFTDIVRATARAAALGDRRWKALLDDHDALIRRQLERFRGREIKSTGDGFLATFDGPGRAIHSATAIVEGARALGIDLRAGLHTGECEVRGTDLGGIAVHIAARVAALAGPGEILVSGSIPPLVVGSQIEFAPKGTQPLKGVPGEWPVFEVKR